MKLKISPFQSRNQYRKRVLSVVNNLDRNWFRATLEVLGVEFLVNVENLDMQATERSRGEECLPTPGTIYNFVTTSQHLDLVSMDQGPQNIHRTYIYILIQNWILLKMNKTLLQLLNVKFGNNYHEPFCMDYKELMLLWLECF